MSRPVVAITCDRRAGGPPPAARRVRPVRAAVFVGEDVVTRVRSSGGIALLIPPGDADAIVPMLDRVDALVITGGAFDIHPRHYGRAQVARLDRVEEDRTALELALAREAVARRLPTLGICGGMQALAVALGGTLVQDIGTQVPGALEHEQPTDPASAWHPLAADAAWAPLLGAAVNSTHHQAVDDPGDFTIVGRAPDGVVEAIALAGHPFCVGVQWHPEHLDGRLFAALVSACG